jgi:tRNA nucleotidyltransferase (CCA-adding enzyme)
LIRELSPPRAVLRIASRLESAGYETWCVGGAVRDALLGHPHLDWDLATAARPEQVKKLFGRRTVPVGVAFGTVGVLDEDGILHEVTTFRRDVLTDGRHATVEFGATLGEDLARRDYTINAIAYDPKTGKLEDPFDGQLDLEKGVIRSVGEPEERMREDRLRALRGIRFAARFGFTIEPPTWNAIAGSAPHLGRLSAERVKQEIEKTMDQVQRPSVAFAMWQKSGAFESLIPPLVSMTGIELATPDHIATPVAAGFVRERFRGVPAAKANRRSMRLIALFAAIDHREVVDTLKALRFSNADAAWISTIISHWQALSAEMRFALESASGPADGALRRWAGLTGRTRLASVIRLAAARWSAERAAGAKAPSPEAVHSAYRRAVRIAWSDPVEIGDLALDGSDLESEGIKGPAVGAMLRKLLETVINDPGTNTRERLLSVVRQGMSGARD